MLAIVYACAVIGMDGVVVEVQVDFNPKAGIPSFTIVGLPDSAVRESRERVKAAVKNTGLRFPNKGYIVNLSPADLPKHSTTYDLAIAVGVLAATDQVPLHVLNRAMFLGELSLDGRVRHAKGVMPMAYAAHQAGYDTLFVASEDTAQAGLVDGINVIPVETLGELVEHLYGLNPITPFERETVALNAIRLSQDAVDFSQIKGQEHSKRALEVAAAGNHNVLMTGAPGTGKSLQARAISGILPRLTMPEALETTRIYSVADQLSSESPLIQTRPFRSPHHTISQAGLVGGGTIPKPGEISLAHRGVLFLDEINEFSTRVLEVLRQPIEDKVVTISRAKGSVTFPANFLLVAARNPCPCGNFGDTARICTCTPNQIARYQAKLSAPLLDRIDIHVDVPRVDYDKLMSKELGESSQTIQKRVEKARDRQNWRFRDYPHLFANADMTVGEIDEFCILEKTAQDVLVLSIRKLQLSARSYHRVLKLSRTIADLDESDLIQVQHVAEALQYRPKQDIG